MNTKTLVGGIALLGTDARVSEGPVDLVIQGGRIAAVRPSGSVAPSGTVIDARNRLLVPGFINGHLHSHEHFHKGRYDNLPLELWMNFVRPPSALPWTARAVYLRTLIGAIEAVRSGTTTLCDDMNVSPVLHTEHVEAAFLAYEEIGIRANVGITLFDKPFFRGMPYVDEEFPPELIESLQRAKSTPPQELLAFARKLARTRHPREHRVGYIVTPSAPQRCTTEFLCQVRELADAFELPLMTHVQETRLQVVTGQAMFGSTLVEYLHRIGFLKANTALIHAVWLNPREIELLADSGASVQHNPVCNLKMGSGIAPVRALLDAGVNVSLGTDGCGSVETADMQKTLRAAALLQKVRGDDHLAWVGAKEAFTAATLGGAKALGMGNELGAIEPGRLADLAVYRLDRIPFVPLNDPLRQLVFSETGASLDMLFVNGETVLEAGRLTKIDEASIVAEINEEHARLEPMLAQSESSVAPIIAAYERILARCRAQGIADDTFPATLSH